MGSLSHRGKSLVVLGGSVVIAAGLYGVGREVSEWRGGSDSPSWKGVEGRIAESEAKRVSGGAKSGGGHRIRIRYRQAVAGRGFEGHGIDVGNHLDGVAGGFVFAAATDRLRVPGGNASTSAPGWNRMSWPPIQPG